MGVTDLNCTIHPCMTLSISEEDHYACRPTRFFAGHGLPAAPYFPERYVARYQGERYVKQFRCLDHYLVMAFAQLTYRESLRDIAVCLRAHQSKLYHMGIRSESVARSTVANP